MKNGVSMFYADSVFGGETITMDVPRSPFALPYFGLLFLHISKHQVRGAKPRWSKLMALKCYVCFLLCSVAWKSIFGWIKKCWLNFGSVVLNKKKYGIPYYMQNLTTLRIKGKVLLTYLNAKYYSVVNPDSSNIANFMPILLNLSQ